ncbi:MAG: exodeoxyribonuclease VII large subunit [Synergistales bacterium]|nr:exodeoxyribonuclease VII large subunit [Synergistales bacterium]
MQPLTVDQLTGRIEGLFLKDPVLQDLHLQGEILGFKKHTSGHLYFKLTGILSRISCVMFRSDTLNLPKWPRDGDEVIVSGRVGIYGARGAYQVYARQIHPVGQGAAARAKAELKAKLEKEGLFDPALKRVLPQFPMKAAIITSSTGAALRDVLKVARSRFPLCRMILVPTLVQGFEAPVQLVQAIQTLRKIPELDMAFLVRGGGSRDDLNPFDDESVVRAVRLAAVPLITGLGHQVDLTLCDLAADAYSSTPSSAAERALPDRKELSRYLWNLKERTRSPLFSRLLKLSSEIMKDLKYIENMVNDRISRYARESVFFQKNLCLMVQKVIDDNRRSVIHAEACLQGLSPLSALERGFITCEDPLSGKPVSSVSLLKLHEEYILHFRDGYALVQVIQAQTEGKDMEV